MIEKYLNPLAHTKVFSMPISTERPSVAVIIPVRNGAAFIDAALASLAAQTAPPTEVIVVDDASEDDTNARVRQWQQVLPLRLITFAERSGTWRARDTAISEATSELIVQLDADDILLPQHVAVMTEAYGRAPGLIAPNRMLLSSSSGGVPEPITERLPGPDEQLAQMLILSFLGVGTLFSKELYEAVGGYRPCSCAEDWDLWIRMSAAGALISRPEQATYIYRMHPSNISSNVRRRETDPEIIQRFLDTCDDPAYRQVAQLSLLVRGGTKHLTGFARKAAPAGDSFWDPDLGTVLVSEERGSTPRLLRITSSEGQAPFFTAELDSHGYLTHCQISDASQLLTTWPDFGEHFQRGRSQGAR
ncbi:glycosyltransferase [Streptomyces sp. NPDC057963]|uniref:glycosyltransferase n=1 Tax=Streptomyces sp. NPDC057963 TaxID=3346290 RepID=UPI0036EFE33F